ncbi:MAG: ParB/RepB/Spo0J family partition protein, partial [Leptospira sp.]|nr:ParB/RepB/Spo0J family partition protein [Leptospira sp.]
MQIKITQLKFHPKNSILFTPKDDEFIRSLATDIHTHGLMEPISISKDLVILSGENRVRAVKLLGWESIDANIVCPTNEIDYLISRNTNRRHLTHKDRIRIYKEICPNFFQMDSISKEELRAIGKRIHISAKTIQSDLTRIRRGDENTKELSIDLLKKLWENKNLSSIKINIIDTDSGMILKVVSRKGEYEFGPGSYKQIFKQAFDAGNSKYFQKIDQANELNQELRQLRISANLTQFQLAQKI